MTLRTMTEGSNHQRVAQTELEMALNTLLIPILWNKLYQTGMGSLKDNPHKNDGAGNNEHYLEIFLFLNGQQDSPPRKYNVQVDDHWDTTLNFLARSQNGSDHTIELYTTDGKKIGKAQELSNGAAYVAVEPPQQFVPSGYNEYLMKASRSREKRQAENGILINPDTTSSKHKTEEELKGGTNIKIVQDITIRPTSRTAVKEQDASAEKVKSHVAKTAKPVGRNNNKHIQKDSSLPQPYALRKNTNNVTRSIKRKSIGPNNNPPNQITKPIERKSNKGGVPGVITIIKNNQESTEATEAYDVLKKGDTGGALSNNSPSYKATKTMTVDSSVLERTILLPVSPEKDLLKSQLVIPVPSKLNLLLEDNDSVPVPEPNVKHIPDTLTTSPATGSVLSEYPKETDLTQIKTAELITLKKDSQKNTSIFGNQTGDNHFTIYVTRNDMENLKLNIEIQRVSSSMLLAKHSHHVKTTTLIVNTPEFDGGAPSKNLAEAKNYREVPTLTEPLHDGHPYGQLQQLAKDLRLGAVCRCDCCSYSRTEAVAPVHVDNNNYFIWLPPEELNEQLLSCACKLATNLEANQEIPDHHELPNKKPIVKHDGDKRLPPITSDANKKIISTVTKILHDPITENQSLKDNGNVDEDTDEYDCCSCSEPLPPSTCGHAQSMAIQSLHCDNKPTTDYGKEQALIKKNPTNFKDADTQTDWSGIILEVRPRENGGYEFHIPSLKVLKMNKSLYD